MRSCLCLLLVALAGFAGLVPGYAAGLTAAVR
jgi:hypothetical protein